MAEPIPPFLPYIIGAVLALLVPNGRLRSAFMLLVPVVGVWLLLGAEHGVWWTVAFDDMQLVLYRLDGLSFVFGLVFNLGAFLAILYAWHIKDTVQQIPTLLYAGGAIGAVFAGDLVTLFIWWEITAITSVFLIWARRTEAAYHTGLRYLIIQVISGVLLLSGALVLVRDTSSIGFDALTLEGMGPWLIFIAFGIKCAFPFLNNWLQDAYPAATATGTVTLSIFTTKLAVYVLARGFPGTEMLIWIGAVMAVFPIFFALIENDLRRTLAYSLNSQLGFMVVGVGIGSALSLNGTAAHAFNSVLYQGLLFMCMGAVLHRTGTTKATELGGLYRYMPITMVFCLVGALAISAFPLTNGYIAKSLVKSAASKEGYALVWAALIAASVGAVAHSGIRIPYAVFLARKKSYGPEVKEAPPHMLLAMGLTAALCIGIGLFPSAFYSILPNDVPYQPYGLTNIVTQLQMLLFALLAFILLMKFGLYPSDKKSIHLDFDWVYRRALPTTATAVGRLIDQIWTVLTGTAMGMIRFLVEDLGRLASQDGLFGRSPRPGTSVAWVVIVLGIAMAAAYSA